MTAASSERVTMWRGMELQCFGECSSSMKDRKDKSQQRLTLCCSMIDLKENKNKKINKEESGGGGDDDITSSSTRRDGLFSAIFGEKSRRYSVCLCCSQIQGLSPKPGTLSVMMLPVEDVKNYEVK
ncbi:uncharacterized protein LOC114319300 isoform X2 [Camellia sinensis]|uniref:uncharacterized protein LOC114319300 isoform X2 n=1 Tax=Camellia sinensis TaxID=4442 RepID=UPI001036BEB2|nr:uncharacterized protein LOC114319300 isoform X2 [Camellia sinensis]